MPDDPGYDPEAAGSLANLDAGLEPHRYPQLSGPGRSGGIDPTAPLAYTIKTLEALRRIDVTSVRQRRVRLLNSPGGGETGSV